MYRSTGRFRVSRVALFWLFLSAGIGQTRTAYGAGPLGGEGTPITTSNYSIDLFQGPVLASARTTGLAGAYAALAEGVDGNRNNAAAPAVRCPWSHTWFDYDLSLDLTFPGTLGRTDFDNDGRIGFQYRDFVFASAGANLQFGTWAFGISADVQHYVLQGITGITSGSRSLTVTLPRGHLLGAHSWLDGQLTIGAGLQFARLSFSAGSPEQDDSTTVFGMDSHGFEIGALWAPTGLPLRLALSARTPSESELDNDSAIVADTVGDTRIGPFYVPKNLRFPWEVEMGWALQFGRRPLNVRWQNPREALRPLREAAARAPRHDQNANRAPADSTEEPTPRAQLHAARRDWHAKRSAEYRALPRQKVLVSASVLLSGPVADGVGFESFLRQAVQPSGRIATLTPRLGVEVEAIPNYVQARGGVYLEPSRFNLGNPRLHGTAGFDVRLFRFSLFGLAPHETCWRAGAYIDVANRYLAGGLSVGIWH